MTFEDGFAESERAASVATKSVGALLSAIKQLQKSASEGEIAALRKLSERIAAALQSASVEVENAITAWPFDPDAEERYLRESYIGELLNAADADGIRVQHLDDGYLAFPIVFRIVPSERAISINRAKVKKIRPSRLVKTIKDQQSAKPKLSPENFLELLHRTYRLLTERQYGQTITLATVYESLTLLPGSSATYGHSEFVRDLYLLDRSGVRRTKAGATLSLPASTGTKGAKRAFSFVSPEGETIPYYGLKFEEEPK